MFKWCSYCQTFLGETEPRENFSLTHGVCSFCKPRVLKEELIPSEGIYQIISFFQDLQNKVKMGDILEPHYIIGESKKLKIDPADLLAGVMQPMLYEIGELYQKGEITVVEEHRFSSFIKTLLFELKKEQFMNSDHSNHSDVFLACAEGNFHEFGISLIEYKLKKLGVLVESITPGLPADQIYNYAKSLKAKIIGVSISSEDQLVELSKLDAIVKKSHHYDPLIISGGFIIRKETKQFSNIVFYRGDINALTEAIQLYLAGNKHKLLAG